MGGVQKGQVISAFKFLGLIDAEGIPQRLLSELALNRAERKTTIRNLIDHQYPNISESDLGTMSGMLEPSASDATIVICLSLLRTFAMSITVLQ
jgi:hypothetical protein